MYETLLKQVGLKITTPRLKILALLHETKAHHWSAEALYQKLVEHGDDLGLATVYRVLTQFEMVGLVKRHQFDMDHSVFELNQGEHHDHLVCVECGAVEEFVDDAIERQQEEIAKKFHFQMKDHRLIIYGLCKNCS